MNRKTLNRPPKMLYLTIIPPNNPIYTRTFPIRRALHKQKKTKQQLFSSSIFFLLTNLQLKLVFIIRPMCMQTRLNRIKLYHSLKMRLQLKRCLQKRKMQLSIRISWNKLSIHSLFKRL